MKKNYSPWISQLKQNRIHHHLERDLTTEITIVGAGIAGVATAFFTLRNTSKKVVMLEKFKLAHGATGHNAGQIVSYFERGFASLVDEFGLSLAASGQKAIDGAWELLELMYTEAGLTIPFSRFLGHAGLSSFEQVLFHLKNNALRQKAGLNTERMIITASADFLSKIPKEYEGLYTTAPHGEILEILETKITEYVAILSYQKGCMNSALFCEEIVEFLSKKYPDRFALYEHTDVQKIVLKKESALLDCGMHTVAAERVVLCTNGFEDLIIVNDAGLEINAKFHHMVQGTIGYMSGYLEKMNKPPTAISYFTDPDYSTEDPYFYLTRRMYEHQGEKEYNLISIGGPEVSLEESKRYSREEEYPEAMEELIDAFVHKTYDIDPNKKIDYVFTWHGLMGYTKNGVRVIGPEPQNPILMYNLGCNGIGILPSIYGGSRIADMISGKNVEISMFDVPERALIDD